MSYYDPYQGVPQQYITQPYYQYYPGDQNEQTMNYELAQHSERGMGFDQIPQYQNDYSSHERQHLDERHSHEMYGNDSGLFLENDLSPSQSHARHLPSTPHLGQNIQDSINLGIHHMPDSSMSFNQNSYVSGLGPNIQGSISAQHNAGPELLYGAPAQSPMVSQAQGGGANGQAAPSRTVYLGNIPSDIEPNELLDYVRSGILENVKILPSKNCAFISFIDLQSALLFHSDCILKKLNIKGHDIRIGWGKNTSILPAVMGAIQRDGATRNVYLGNLNNPSTGQIITEEELREDLSTYGVIDCIKIIPEKGIAFIHFLSILSAIRCVSNLPLKEKYLDKKCFYGKDRCAFITKTQQHNAAQYLGLAPGMEHVVTAADREFISSALVQQSAAAAQIATQAGGANNLGNRTVYLGNLHQDSSVEEICNVVRGGLLQSIRFLKERHVCFITFIDPIAAAQFFAMCQLHGLTIHNRRIKVGWGKHSGPLSNALSLAVSNGASRNIYIGNITNFEYYNLQKLREDFSTFGDIEQINFLEEKNCAFINFVNIANAIKAIDGIKSFDDYKTLKINFGKDRCGNLPRQFQNQNPMNQTLTMQHHANSMAQQPLTDEGSYSGSDFAEDLNDRLG